MLQGRGLEAFWSVVVLSLFGCGGGLTSTGSPDGGYASAGGGGADSGSSSGPALRNGSGGSGSGSGSGGSASGSGNGGSGSGSGGERSSGSVSDASGESSSGVTFDASGATGDASVQYEAAPSGLAGFAFVVNGAVLQPMACPSDNWEFLGASNGMASGDQCSFMAPFGCPGVTSAVLINTGQVPWAYTVSSLWNGTGYVPGVLTGDPSQLAGVLSPSSQVDITSVYNGGIVAVLGSAEPFSSPDAGKYVSDEGTIPWPAGVAGSGGATQMNVAEIEVRTSCGIANVVW
jgi:hypothetical protein